jgi:glutathione S-transferase
MALNFIMSSVLPIAGALSFESYILRSKFPSIYSGSQPFSLLPRGYSAVILCNIVGSSIVIIALGFKVGKARSAMKEKAKLNGDAEADARFSYPKTYAEGFSEESYEFNCIQRGHQQALETYPIFLTLSVIGGLSFPVTVAAGGALWSYARLKWAEGYAIKVDKRYSHWSSKGIWTGLFVPLVASVATAVKITGLI